MKNIHNSSKTIQFSKSQWIELEKLAAIEDIDQRRIAFRNYFHTQEMFDYIKDKVDPSWLAHDMTVNSESYGL